MYCKCDDTINVRFKRFTCANPIASTVILSSRKSCFAAHFRLICSRLLLPISGGL